MEMGKKILIAQKKIPKLLRAIYVKKKKTGPKFQFGEQVPRTIKEAYQLDQT